MIRARSRSSSVLAHHLAFLCSSPSPSSLSSSTSSLLSSSVLATCDQWFAVRLSNQQITFFLQLVRFLLCFSWPVPFRSVFFFLFFRFDWDSTGFSVALVINHQTLLSNCGLQSLRLLRKPLPVVLHLSRSLSRHISCYLRFFLSCHSPSIGCLSLFALRMSKVSLSHFRYIRRVYQPPGAQFAIRSDSCLTIAGDLSTCGQLTFHH